MRIAVTGSSGLIGTALVASLEADGHEVVRLRVRAGEPVDAAALEGADGVVHLAGAGIGDKRWTPERKREVIESRSKGTAALCEALAATRQRPAVLVSGSAIGYYGDRGDEVLVESSRPGEGFLTEICLAWEGATAAAADAGIRVATIRTGIVLSHEGGALGKLRPLFRAGLGGRLGSGRQWWSWITLDDEVRAIRWLLEHEVSGPVNLTAPNPVTNADFTRSLASALHRPALLPVPSFGPGLLLGRELAHHLLFASQRVVPSVLAEHGFRFDHAHLDEALRSVV